jgi:hypothetical protein
MAAKRGFVWRFAATCSPFHTLTHQTATLSSLFVRNPAFKPAHFNGIQ